MERLAWILIILGDLITIACAVYLTAQSHRYPPAEVVRPVRRTAPALLAAALLPLPALLATDAPAAAWGLWGATTIAAVLVHAAADTLRDQPGQGQALPARSGPESARKPAQ